MIDDILEKVDMLNAHLASGEKTNDTEQAIKQLLNKFKLYRYKHRYRYRYNKQNNK